ncbi:unnamed protein product [Rotaria magnacalcarata]|nr:unnamed protein product [Rotaria magnacalcarata]
MVTGTFKQVLVQNSGGCFEEAHPLSYQAWYDKPCSHRAATDCFVPVQLDGKSYCACIDSGTSCSMMSISVADELFKKNKLVKIKDQKINLLCAGGLKKTINTRIVAIDFMIGTGEFKNMQFMLTPDHMMTSCFVIGTDILRLEDISIDFGLRLLLHHDKIFIELGRLKHPVFYNYHTSPPLVNNMVVEPSENLTSPKVQNNINNSSKVINKVNNYNTEESSESHLQLEHYIDDQELTQLQQTDKEIKKLIKLVQQTNYTLPPDLINGPFKVTNISKVGLTYTRPIQSIHEQNITHIAHHSQLRRWVTPSKTLLNNPVFREYYNYYSPLTAEEELEFLEGKNPLENRPQFQPDWRPDDQEESDFEEDELEENSDSQDLDNDCKVTDEDDTENDNESDNEPPPDTDSLTENNTVEHINDYYVPPYVSHCPPLYTFAQPIYTHMHMPLQEPSPSTAPLHNSSSYMVNDASDDAAKDRQIMPSLKSNKTNDKIKDQECAMELEQGFRDMHYNIDKGNLVTSEQPVVTQYNSPLPSITPKSSPQVINNTIHLSPITPTYNQINTQATPKEIPHSSTLGNVTPIITDIPPNIQQNSFINNNYLDKSEIDSPINNIDPSTNLSVYNCSNDETIIQDMIAENNFPSKMINNLL